jgi:HD-like signal output (HDOD) protein
MDSPGIVFIDDQSSVLNALRTMLKQSHRDWNMHFFSSPAEAQNNLSAISPWLVVASKHLADGDGATLLQQVAERVPEAIRVLLVDDAQPESALQGSTASHFVLRKPLERDAIEDLLIRARVLHQLPLSASRRRQLGQLNGLPVLPRIYQRITLELDKPEPDVAAVAALIREDQSLLSRVLKLVNSPFFGFSSRTAEVEVAVMRLGLQTIHNLVLITELYHQDASPQLKAGDRLMRDALLLAEQVGVVCAARNVSRTVRNQAVISALLHNLGCLVLALHENSQSDSDKPTRQEISILSAYLLELWGFESEVVEAVLHQEDELLPDDCDQQTRILNIALKMQRGVAVDADPSTP